MSPDVELVAQLLARALDLPPGERAAFVEREACGDVGLRAELASLLAHHEADSAFLGGTPARPCAPSAPLSVASYRILGLLGEGGMGVVYRAEQDRPRRVVALKLIRPGCLSPRMLQRFEREAQLLGRLHHPGIAQVYEAGSALVAGVQTPFLALELVEGAPITRHAEQAGLDRRARLELLLEVCDALEHAHREGVLHRDLKPANVLIDTRTARARPKLLDFGIARAASDVADAFRTETGQIVGTPDYMSPEQAGGTRAELDARSDVYALGVLAYELLTGRLPLHVGALPLLEAARLIREEEAPPAGRFDPALRGDLETILAKALEKEPARRYASAAEFAFDVRAVLAEQPIRARPASRIYRLRKFTRRNRAPVIGALAVFLVLCGGIAATRQQAVHAADARDRAEDAHRDALAKAAEANTARGLEAEQRRQAERERNRAGHVSEYFQHLLATVVPGERGPDARLLDLLEHAAAELPGTLTEAPEAEVDVRATLGQAFQRLGRLEESEEQLRGALELCRARLPDDELRQADLNGYLGAVLLERDRLAEADPLLSAAAARLAELAGPRSHRAVQVLMKLGRLRLAQGRTEEAETQMRRGLELAREGTSDFGEEDVASALGTLGQIATRKGRLADAEELQRGALEVQLRLHGEAHPASVSALGNLACTLQLEDRLDEAESLHRRAVAQGAALQGERHPDQIARLNNLAGLLETRKRFPEAVELRRRVAALTEEVLGPAHENTLIARGNLALLCAKGGSVDESECILSDLLEIESARFGRGDPRALGTRYNLAWLLRQRGRFDEACAAYVELLQLAGAALSPDDWQLALFRAGLGGCLLSMKRYEDAELVLLQACFDLERLLGPAHQHARTARTRLVELYTAWGRSEQAASWR